MLNLGYFIWFFKYWYIHFTVGSYFAFYGLRSEPTILQQLWYNHSTVKNMFFGQKITTLQAFPILQCKMVVPSTPCLFQRGLNLYIWYFKIFLSGFFLFLFFNISYINIFFVLYLLRLKKKYIYHYSLGFSDPPPGGKKCNIYYYIFIPHWKYRGLGGGLKI